MPTLLETKNTVCAITINRCIDILLDQNANEETVTVVSSSLKTILKNIMPYLRGVEENQRLVEKAIKTIEDLQPQITTLPSSIFTDCICRLTNIPQPEAYNAVVPVMCKVFAQKLLEDNLDAPEDDISSIPLKRAFDRITAIICNGEPIISVANQLSFINEVLNVKSPEFIGEQKCSELIDLILSNADKNYFLDKNYTEELVYGLFNKIRLKYVREYCNENPTPQNSEILAQLTERFELENGETFIDDPFFTKKQDRLEFVKGLQKYTLETLVLTKKFLDQHGLRFYLTEGTLLGAIRHNGFIPWDDDVDIAMPREDYDRLVKLAKEGKIPPELNFDALENNPQHWVLGAKMQLVKKTPYIQHKVTKLSKCNGPYVDIFPLDYWDKPAGIKAWMTSTKIRIARRLLFIKTGYSKATKKKLERIIARVLLIFIKNKWIEKFAIKTLKKQYSGSRKYMVNLCSYYPYYKEVFPTGFFGNPVYVDFEGHKMPIPCEYDYMLKTVYSRSYDTIPPVRVTNMRKHAFDFNPNFAE